MIKSKRLLRFYFNAEELERALNNLIISDALKSCDCAKGGEYCADRIIDLIECKKRLADLWGYIDGVISQFRESEIAALECYALSRCGIKSFEDERRREIKRALIKFVRHAKGIERFAEGMRLITEYYCLM